MKYHKVNSIIRYDKGPTAIMKISYISKDHGGNFARYYGTTCFGSSIGVYHSDAKKACEIDLKNWIKYNG